MTPPDRPFFVAGGTLRHDVPSYVEREADRELLAALRAGEFCYVLTARQVGKSSLMVRTAARLREAGVRTAILDLSALGQNVTPEQWYQALLVQLGMRLDCAERLEACWHVRPEWAPLQRFMGALEALLSGEAAEASTPLVVFIDEIDAVRSLPFPTDELFAAIRACHNRRADEPALRRLTFCLLGVASPSDLIRDPRVTPFNIGRRIDLPDFTPAEAAPLALGFHRGDTELHGEDRGRERRREGEILRSGSVSILNTQYSTPNAQRLIERVLYWTGGHPYLTQRLCQAIAEALAPAPPQHSILNTQHSTPDAQRPTPNAQRLVDRLVRELFLKRGAREQDDNLIFVRERILRSEVPYLSSTETVTGLLERYREIRAGRPVQDDDTDPLIELLKLAGIVRPGNGRLEVRNRIYRQAFDAAWIDRHLPDAEVRRQRAAYRRGLLRAAGLAGAVVASLSVLAAAAVGQAGAARKAERRAFSAAEGLRRALAQQSATMASLGRALGERDQQRASADRSRALAVRQAQQARRSARAAEQNAVKARESSALAGVRAREARTARLQAVARQRESQERLVALTTARGTDAVERGDLFSALGWYARAASLSPGDPEEQAIHRLRAGSLLRHLPRLVRVWFDVSDAHYNGDGTRILSIEGRKVVHVRDADTLQPTLPPLRPDIDLGAVVMSEDGRRIFGEVGNAFRAWDAARGMPRGRPFLDLGGSCSWALSPDGKRIAAAGHQWAETLGPNDVRYHYDPVARVWDFDTARPITPVIRTAGPAMQAAFHPDGRRFAVGCINGVVQLFDAATGAEQGPRMKVVDAPVDWDDGVWGLAFSPDGRRLLAVSPNGAVVWDVGTRQRLLRLEHPGGRTTSARFSPDGRLLATLGDATQVAQIWNAATGQRLTPPLPHAARIANLSFSRDSRRVATASEDGSARVWDAGTGEPLTPPLPHGAQVVTAAFDASGRRLLTRDVFRRLRLWDLAGAETLALCLNEQGGISTAAWSPDGRRLLTGQDDGTARVWDSVSGRPLGSFPAGVARINDLLFSVAGSRMVASAGSVVRVWSRPAPLDAARLQAQTPLELRHSAPVTAIALDRAGRRLIAAAGHEAVVWDLATGRRLSALSAGREDARAVALSADGARAVLGTNGGSTLVSAAATGRILARCRQDREVNVVELSPDGRRLLTAGADQWARLWDAATGRFLHASHHQAWLHHAAFSPDGRLYVTASGDRLMGPGEARLWSTLTGQPVGPPLRHRAAVLHAAFSPDGRLVVTSSGDRTARVWRTATSEAVSPPLPHRGAVWASGFAPVRVRGGYRLLTGSNDGTVQVWDLPAWPGTPRELERVAADLTGNSLDRLGGSAPMPREAQNRGLAALAGAHPGLLRTTPEQVTSWHLREAHEAERVGSMQRFLLQLDRLVGLHPERNDWRVKKAALCAFLGRTAAVREDLRALGIAPPGLAALELHGALKRPGAERAPRSDVSGTSPRSLYLRYRGHLVVFLPSPARRFLARARLAPQRGLRRDVQYASFRLLVERQDLASVFAYAERPPVPLSVDLSGRTAFSLATDMLNQWSQAQAVWEDARVELEDGRVLWLADLPVWTMGQP
jgi:WD40 repeat protein